MKNTTTRTRILAGSIAALLAVQSAQATLLYWDTNSTTAGSGAATGTWGTSSFWNTDPLGGGAGSFTAATTSADDLVIAAGTNGTGGNISLSGATQSANSITFDDNVSVTLDSPLIQNNSSVTADNTTDIFTYAGTAVQNGQVVYFGGTTAPTGLNANQLYFIINATATTYQVSTTAGGAAINFTSNGTAVTNTVQAPLTLGGGSGAGIFVLAGDNAANTVSAPIVLASNASFSTAGNGLLDITGSITGTGNLSLINNGLLSNIRLNGGSVNHVGTISYTGTSYGQQAFNIGGTIGSNVTGITQNSNTSNFTIGNNITVNSGGTTFTTNGLQSLTWFRDNTDISITGTGNVIFNNNSRYAIPMGIDLCGRKFSAVGYLVDNNGAITNSGTGIGGTRIDAKITTTPTAINQNSATSNLYLTNVVSQSGAVSTQPNNTFTGAVNLNAGILYAGYANALTTAGTINFGGGTLMYQVTSATDLSAKFTTTGTTPYSIDTSGLAFSAGLSFTFATNLAANSTKGLSKFGLGTLTLTAANTYTGTTTIGGGTGTLERLGGGTLQVGNGTIGSLNGTTGTALTFGGTGTLSVVEAGTSTQGMGMLTFSAGDGTVSSTRATSAILTFSSLASRASGAVGNFVIANGTNGTDNKIVLTGQSTGFINSGLFFGGSGYAAYDAGTFVRALVYGTDTNASASIGAGTSFGINDATKNIQITGTISTQPTASVNTLKISGAANITLTGTLSLNGILKSGGNASTISAGTALQTTGSGNELVIRTDLAADTLAINAPILANGTNTLTKSGAGIVKLSGANTYTGNTAINDGTLILDTPANATYGGVISGAGALLVTGPGTLTLNRTATFTGGLTLVNGTLKLDFSDAGAPSAEMLNGVNRITFGTSTAGSVLNGVQGGGTLLIKAKATGITTQNLGIPTLGSGNTGINVTNAGSHKLLVDTNGGTETQVLFGVLDNVLKPGNTATNGSGLLIGKTAAGGTVTFMYATEGSNGPSNATFLSGRLVYTPDGGNDVDFVTTSQQSNSPYNLIPLGTGGFNYTTLLATGNGSNDYSRFSSANPSLIITGGGNISALKIQSPGAGKSITITAGQTLTPQAGFIMTGSDDFTITGGNIGSNNNGSGRSYMFNQYSTGTLTVSSVLNNISTNPIASVLKLGPGRLVLSGANIYPGNTYFSEGTLNAGVAQTGTTNGPFGTGAGGASTSALFFAGGTLQYSAANQFDYSPRFQTTVGQPIRIDTNGQNVTFATALTSQAGTVTLADTNSTPGNLTLSNAANTYTGATTVTGGTLKLAAANTNNIASSSTINVGAGAFLNITGLSGSSLALASGQTLKGNGTVTGGLVTVSSGAILAPGASPGTLNFGAGLTIAAGGIFQWENNTVNTLGTVGTNWDSASVTGTTTISNTATTGSQLKLLFTDVGTSFADTFWNTNRTYGSFVTGGVSAGNLFDGTNITVFISGSQQGATNTIAGQGTFTTAVNGSNLDLIWTALSSGNNSQILITSAPDSFSGVTGASAKAIAFGRVLSGGTQVTGSQTITNSGTDTATYTVTLGGDVSASGFSSGTLATGSTSGTITLNTATTGSKSGTVTIANTSADSFGAGLGSAEANDVFTVTATALANRTLTATALGSLGLQHVNATYAGPATTTVSTAASTAGDDNRATRVTLGGGTDGSLTVASSATVFNTASQSEGRSVTGTLATSGAISGSVSLSTAVDGSETATGTTPQTTTVSYTASVFNGTGKWTSVASGSWGTNANWTDSNTINAAPGTFAGFANVDTATLDGTGGGTVISLNGTSPSVKKVEFTNAAATVAYTIDNTGGGTLTMKSSAGDAMITSSSTVTETISAPVALATNSTVSVTSTGLLSTTGNISQSGGDKTLTKDGTGTLDLNGTLQAYKTLTVNDGTANVNGTLGVTPGTAVVSVTDTVGGVATKLRFGSVSQTLSSLTIGAGATVTFTSGTAMGAFSGGSGGKAPSFGGGSAVVPEPGTLGLLLVGALGLLNRRRYGCSCSRGQ